MTATAPSPSPSSDAAASTLWRRLRPSAPLAVLVVLVLLPFSTLPVPGVFDNALNSPDTLRLLALCLVFGGLAISYDLLYGRTGMLSFGHALYFAAGAYTAALLTEWSQLPLVWAVVLATLAGTLLAAVLAAVSLQVSGIALAMVTLAFAQAGYIFVSRDPGRFTGGEEGLSLNTAVVPDALVGVWNTVNVYWLALGYAALTAAVVWWLVASPAGRVWSAIRTNEQRVAVLGLNTFVYKWAAFVVGAALASLGGAVYLVVAGGVTPGIATAEFTLLILVMVSLGGSGTRWGPLIGGVVYTYVEHRLNELSGSGAFQALPEAVGTPLSEPLFVLGVLFVVVVFFFPGGLAALPGRVRGWYAQRRGT